MIEFSYDSVLDVDLDKVIGDHSSTMKFKFDTLYHMLVEYNTHTNITAIVDKLQVYVKHFADSLLALDLIRPNTLVLDIGCGAGFPSLPLALVIPSCEFLLVDSVSKKIKFVESVIDKCDINNAKALHARAEDIKNKQYYDYCVSRAVAPLGITAELSLPFIKLGGYMLAYKAIDVDEELQQSKKAIELLGGVVENVITKNIDYTNIVRKIIVIKKIKPTHFKYPRGGNKPRLLPL